MTIFVTWQSRVTVDSIHNSCDVFVQCRPCTWYSMVPCYSMKRGDKGVTPMPYFRVRVERRWDLQRKSAEIEWAKSLRRQLRWDWMKWDWTSGREPLPKHQHLWNFTAWVDATSNDQRDGPITPSSEKKTKKMTKRKETKEKMSGWEEDGRVEDQLEPNSPPLKTWQLSF